MLGLRVLLGMGAMVMVAATALSALRTFVLPRAANTFLSRLVFVTIRGQGKEFTIKPTSEPPLPETEIYTLLATGRRTLRAGSGASMNQGQVASVLGSLLASQARKALAAKLPLDVLSIEAGEEGLTDARLEVGKYLTDNLYLGYRGRLGSPQNQSSTRRENNNAVRLEYQFSPRWSLEGEYGDAQQGGADVIWSKDY